MNQKDAPYKERSAFLEDIVHEVIFYGLSKTEEKYPLFNRMNDYYGDTKYKSGEPEELIDEIMNIKNQFTNNSQVTEQLHKVLSACKTAKKDGTNVYVYGD